MTARRLRGPNNEGILLLSIVVLGVVIGIADPSFWSSSTLLNIATSSLDDLLFAMGVLIVLIAGGIDVSFMAIGIFAGYAVVLLGNDTGFGGGTAWAGFAIAAAIGLGLGLVNAGAIAGLRLPTLIATLGTAGIVRGVLLGYIGSKVIGDLPASSSRTSPPTTS